MHADPAGFYRVEVVDADSAAPGDLLGGIFARAPNAVVVRDFLDGDAAARVVARIAAGAVAAPRRRFAREFEAFSIGPCLDQAERGLDEYFSEAAPFAAALAALFADGSVASSGNGRDFETRLLGLFARLGGGRAIERPRDPEGRPYALATLRCLPPGGRIPPHCENEQLERAPYRHLGGLLDPSAIVSFYLTLAPAESGGEVSVHELGFAELDRAARRDGHLDFAARLDGRARVTIKPAAGELLIFDGGRFAHQVLPVGGARDRWTLGGFLGRSADGRALLVWA